MTLIHMTMTPSLGMITQMRTSMVLDVLEKWLPIGMASVVLGLLMVPKLEVRNNYMYSVHYHMLVESAPWPILALLYKMKARNGSSGSCTHVAS